MHPVGRNGMHRYNNQDHSMKTAMLTAENIATGSRHDVWDVNVEEEYHETSSSPMTEPGPTDDADKGARPMSGSGTGRDAPVIAREHFGEDHPVNRPPTGA